MRCKNRPIARRTFLQAAGITVSLPLLDAMQPSSRAVAAQAESKSPLRFAVFRQAQGTVAEHWLPKVGAIGDDLPSLLVPYQGVKDKLTVVSNLTSSAMVDGKHYRAGHDLSMSLFTAAPSISKKTGHASTSIDQYIAQHIGKDTPISSLGLSQRSQSTNLFWSNEATKVPLEGNPYLVFERLFKQAADLGEKGRGGNTTRDIALQAKAERSILDLVVDQTNRLKRDLGLRDQRQLEQYMESIRETERRMELYANRKLDALAQQKGVSKIKIPKLTSTAEEYRLDRNDPEQADLHVRIMCDLLVLAFQTDSTRVGMMDFDFGYFPDIVSVGTEYDFHTLAHHGSKNTIKGSDPVAREAVREIYYWHSKQVAYLAQKMDQIEEPDGTLLDNSLIVHTSELAFGDHFADNIPMALVGRAGGNIRSGRHVACGGITPVSHLWTEIANRMGVATEAFGNAKDHPNNDTASLPSLG